MSLLRSLVTWYLKPAPLLASALSVLVVASALGVAYSSHQTRNMYRDLQQLEKARDDLEHEYEMLLLERGAKSDYAVLNEIAHDDLAMNAPTAEEMVVIQ